MTHATKIAALLVLLIAMPAHAGRGGGYGGGGGHGGGQWHGGGHGHGGGSWHGHGHGHFHGGWGPSIFIGGYWDPFWPGYYPYPYYYGYPYPYPYSYPYYPPAAETDDRYARDQAREPPPAEAPAQSALPASYGLIQIRGVPNGAQIDLDDRFWLEARDIDDKWMAISEGRHAITVRVDGSDPVTREVEMRPGAKQVIKFGPFRRG